jgi:hypothetical protein
MNRQAYLRELTYELRSRKNDDSAIRVVLRELPAELSGEELEREFGSAHDYAANFLGLRAGGASRWQSPLPLFSLLHARSRYSFCDKSLLSR